MCPEWRDPRATEAVRTASYLLIFCLQCRSDLEVQVFVLHLHHRAVGSERLRSDGRR